MHRRVAVTKEDLSGLQKRHLLSAENLVFAHGETPKFGLKPHHVPCVNSCINTVKICSVMFTNSPFLPSGAQ